MKQGKPMPDLQRVSQPLTQEPHVYCQEKIDIDIETYYSSYRISINLDLPLKSLNISLNTIKLLLQ